MTKVGIDSELLREAMDFDVWYGEWFPRATKMARNFRLEDPEDAAAAALFSFWNNGNFEKWDPDGGACMNTWTFRIVQRRLLDYYKTQKRRRAAEYVDAYNALGDASAGDGEYGFDLAAETDSGDTESIDWVELRESLRQTSNVLHLTVESESNCHPADLFDAVAGAALAGEKAPVKELAARFGVNSSTLGHQRRSLASFCEDTGLRSLLAS